MASGLLDGVIKLCGRTGGEATLGFIPRLLLPFCMYIYKLCGRTLATDKVIFACNHQKLNTEGRL